MGNIGEWKSVHGSRDSIKTHPFRTLVYWRLNYTAAAIKHTNPISLPVNDGSQILNDKIEMVTIKAGKHSGY